MVAMGKRADPHPMLTFKSSSNVGTESQSCPLRHDRRRRAASAPYQLQLSGEQASPLPGQHHRAGHSGMGTDEPALGTCEQENRMRELALVVWVWESCSHSLPAATLR